MEKLSVTIPDNNLISDTVENVSRRPDIRSIVREGRARFMIGERTIDAEAGDVLLGPAAVPHKYENLGPGRLETTDVHLCRERSRGGAW